MILEAEIFKAQDMEFKKKVKAINALDDYLYKVRKVMEDNSVTTRILWNSDQKFPRKHGFSQK